MTTFAYASFSQGQDRSPALLPPSRCPAKPTLVLDLDETLVHAQLGEARPKFPAKPFKVGEETLWLAFRPFVDEFLSSLAAHYELVVWTAGTEPYGRLVVNELDPSGSLISHSLFRQHCTREEGSYIKDLSLLGRDGRTRLCDNNARSFRLQPEAGILVKDFFGDTQDVELVKLLRELTPMDDVEMIDVEHVPSYTRRVHFGSVHVKVYDPNEPPYVEEVDMLDIDVDHSKKRSPRPRVSNGGPLRRSARLAAKNPRRSPRLAAKRLAAKP